MQRYWIFKSFKVILWPIAIWAFAVYSLYNLNNLYTQIAEVQNKNLLIHLKSEWLRFSIISALFLVSSIYAIFKVAHNKFLAEQGSGITIQDNTSVEPSSIPAKIIELKKTTTADKVSRTANL